jgi:hypothetical protein
MIGGVLRLDADRDGLAGANIFGVTTFIWVAGAAGIVVVKKSCRDPSRKTWVMLEVTRERRSGAPAGSDVTSRVAL